MADPEIQNSGFTEDNFCGENKSCADGWHGDGWASYYVYKSYKSYNGFFSAYTLNGLFALLSVNAAFCLFGLNSIFSILSVVSMMNEMASKRRCFFPYSFEIVH